MTRAAYPSDVSNEQWEILKPLLPWQLQWGRTRSVELREIINGIFYLLHNRCIWQGLPHDLPPWPTVATYFYRWPGSWVGSIINDALRKQLIISEGRKEDARPVEPVADMFRLSPTGSSGAYAFRKESSSPGRQLVI